MKMWILVNTLKHSGNIASKCSYIYIIGSSRLALVSKNVFNVGYSAIQTLEYEVFTNDGQMNIRSCRVFREHVSQKGYVHSNDH